MGDSKLTRLRAKLLRRSSTSSAKADSSSPYNNDDTTAKQGASNVSLGLDAEERQHKLSDSPKQQMSKTQSTPPPKTRRLPSTAKIPVEKFEAINTPNTPTETNTPPPTATPPLSSRPAQFNCPKVTLEGPTPEVLSREGTSDDIKQELAKATTEGNADEADVDRSTNPTSQSQRPNIAQRRQSLVPYSQTRLIKTLLESDRPPQTSRSNNTDYFAGALPSIQANMIHRKVWVKRAGASATLVSIHEDDVVDDVRDAILRKYSNSLGRSFDAPDVTLKIVSRDQSGRSGNAERVLGPEEPIGRTLDAYYPGGQMVEDALIIDVPQRRTPRPSPRQHIPYYFTENIAPGEGGEYFPPMPAVPSPNFPPSASLSSGQPGSHHPSIHSMSVLTTGQLPPLPSPGSRGTRHPRRPNAARQHTSSPTILTSVPPSAASSERKQSSINGIAEIPAPPPLPTAPAGGGDPSNPHKAVTPPARVSSPRPPQTKSKKSKKSPPNERPPTNLSSGLLDSTIPPINVLIVEDNIINLKLLEAFMKRLKVRWQTAMNGREAVTKWRNGGFHLVLMDIQLPVLNGLDATKEIRRLERLNNIGAFSTSVSDINTPTSATALGGFEDPPRPDDILENSSVFKSPVIIVALTASSLQSDRHEALAAGCNDFLTKPVNFVWLERKVTEWGCMQALIDYDGWRKWKDFSSPPVSAKSPNTKEHASLGEALKAQKASAGSSTPAGAKNLANREQSPVAQRVNSVLSNGSLGKPSKKGPARRGNGIALPVVDGGDEEEV